MKSIEQILALELETGKSPSIQYYLFDQDKILREFRSGFANVGLQTPVDSSTTYCAFSVTKTFTALAVLQLAEQHKLDLEAPVIQYLPDFLYGPDITIRQILAHTAGIPNPIPLSWIYLESERESFDQNQFIQELLAKNKQVKSKPNEKFAYTNLGYLILGQLIEKISGKSYEVYITENIINKLPVDQSQLSFEIRNKAKHATGYHKNWSFSNLILGLFIDKSKFMGKPEGKWKPFKTACVKGAAYGGLIGTPMAFVKYVQTLLKPDNPLISEGYKTLLFEENLTNNQQKTGMCLSWYTGQLHGNTYFRHAGGGGGYYCEVRIYPALNLGSVVFFNRTGMTDERFLDKVDGIYLKNH